MNKIVHNLIYCEPLNTGWTYKDKIIKCPLVTVYTNVNPSDK